VSATALRVAIAVVAGVFGFLAAHFGRGYQVELSVVTGVALGLLAFAVLRTIERMRRTLRR
jgi:hypothetical protein